MWQDVLSVSILAAHLFAFVCFCWCRSRPFVAEDNNNWNENIYISKAPWCGPPPHVPNPSPPKHHLCLVRHSGLMAWMAWCENFRWRLAQFCCLRENVRVERRSFSAFFWPNVDPVQQEQWIKLTKMKFAEHLTAHITPEWRKQYINYEVRRSKDAVKNQMKNMYPMDIDQSVLFLAVSCWWRHGENQMNSC